jgi:hypothetical protein
MFAVAVTVFVPAVPPVTVVTPLKRSEAVLYSNLGVVEVDNALIDPLSVAEVELIAVAAFVVAEPEFTTAVVTLSTVHPPAGLTAASSFASCSFRSAAMSATDTPAATDKS